MRSAVRLFALSPEFSPVSSREGADAGAGRPGAFLHATLASPGPAGAQPAFDDGVALRFLHAASFEGDDPGAPQAEVLPTSGVADNGKPIYDWDTAAAQIGRANAFWGAFLGASATVTYAYRSTAPGTMPSDTAGFQRFTEAQIVATEKALQYWSDVANITFVRVGSGTTGEGAYANSATILFADYTTGAAGASAFAFFPGSTNSGSSAGDVWVNITQATNATPDYFTAGPRTILHEIGHAIGLSHPSNYNAQEGLTITYAADAIYWQDANMFTTMSYFASASTGANLGGFANSPQMHDIAAIQRLYGANFSTRSGDTTYGFNSTSGRENSTINSAAQAIVFSLWDGGGNDTLDLSGYSQNADIDLRPESFSSAGPDTSGGTARYNISIPRGVVIERAIGGSGDDTITGNDAANTLIGNAGNDTLDGGAGNDTLTGGLGDDIYVVDSASDAIVELAGQGSDTARTTLANFSLNATAGSFNIENLAYIGSGNFVGVAGPAAGALTGGPGNDTLIGSQAGGSLDGGDGADVLWFYGATALQGGPGVDYAIQLDQSAQVRSIGPLGIEIYVGNVGADTIDSVGSPVSSIIYGGAGGDSLTLGAAGGFLFGQDGNDTLTGGSGADTLLGNAGADTLIGGDGNDVLYIDLADGTNFSGGNGVDYLILESSGDIALTFSPSQGIEVFVSNGGADNINAAGINYAMGLYGGAGNDTIVGPSASSQLFGMDGNDILNAGALNDIVLGGAGADQLFGNAGDDLLIGEAGDDLLVGGAGADILWGDVNGAGNDTFRFAAGDVQAGVRDQINDFGDAAGNQDVIQLSGIAQNQVTIANDGSGNVLLTIAASGGSYSILVIGMSAAAIQDDLVFGP